MKLIVPLLFIILLAIAANIFGLLWLTVAVLVTGLLLLAGSISKKVAKRMPVKRLRHLMWLPASAIVSAVLLRLFVFEVFNIPSSSMENTLIPGDRIVVNKLLYGPSLPRSPLDIPWFNAFFLLNRKAEAKDAELEWEYYRLPGMQKINRGDVLVFRYPLSPFQNFVKRCVALPGDTVRISGGVVYINGIRQNYPVTSKIVYNIYLKNRAAFNTLYSSFNQDNTNLTYNDSLHCCVVNLIKDELNLLKKTGLIDSISIEVLDSRHTVLPPLPHTQHQWTPDNFGPFVVPRKGAVITVNEKNLILYKTALQKYEHFNPQLKNGKYFINGQEVTTCTFSQDYYFMMGDNRHNSTDSRYWGAVPEELITGKVVKVLWSGSFTKLKTGRVWKKVE
jgi:signal peptidase I